MAPGEGVTESGLWQPEVTDGAGALPGGINRGISSSTADP